MCVLLQPWVFKSSTNKRDVPITFFLEKYFEELLLDRGDWRTPLKAKFISLEGVADLKDLKDYVLLS